jgi:hypothetical protein
MMLTGIIIASVSVCDDELVCVVCWKETSTGFVGCPRGPEISFVHCESLAQNNIYPTLRRVSPRGPACQSLLAHRKIIYKFSVV